MEAFYESGLGVKCFLGLFGLVKNRVFSLKMRVCLISKVLLENVSNMAIEQTYY